MKISIVDDGKGGHIAPAGLPGEYFQKTSAGNNPKPDSPRLYQKETTGTFIKDFKLPGKSSITLIHAIKARNPEAEGIFMSGGVGIFSWCS